MLEKRNTRASKKNEIVGLRYSSLKRCSINVFGSIQSQVDSPRALTFSIFFDGFIEWSRRNDGETVPQLLKVNLRVETRKKKLTSESR